MRFKSAVWQQVSGSLSGGTYARNAGGLYVRARSIPTDPASVFQTLIRGIIASLVNRWGSTLTVQQRAAWNTYAANVPLTDVFGDPRHRSGINHYVRSNTPRLQFGGTRIDDGPTEFNLGEYTTPSYAASEAAQTIETAFDNTDDWATEDAAYLCIWASRPQNPTIDFFKGPYRAMGLVEGDSGGAPGSPKAISAPFAFAEGNKLFCKANVSRADGRLGTVTRGFCLAAA